MDSADDMEVPGNMNRLFKIQRQCGQPWWPVAANGLDPRTLTMMVMGWWLSMPSSHECSRKVHLGNTSTRTCSVISHTIRI